MRQAVLLRDPRRTPSLRFFRLADRFRLLPVLSYAFASGTVVETIEATSEGEHTWLRICVGDDEILRCRATDADKTAMWKDALTAARVLTGLLMSMKATKDQASSGTSGMPATAVILKSVYMLKSPHKKFRLWYEVKREPTSDSRMTIIARSGKRIKEVFFDPKVELHQGDLVLVTDRSCPDERGKEKYHMIKMRSPHNYGYINQKVLQAAFLQESQAGLLRFLTPSVQKFLLHGTLADVQSEKSAPAASRRVTSADQHDPIDNSKIFRKETPSAAASVAASTPSMPSPSASALSPSSSSAGALPAASSSSAASLEPPRPGVRKSSSQELSSSPFNIHRKRSFSTDSCRPRFLNHAASAHNLTRLSRPRLQSRVRHQQLAIIAIKTQLQNKKGTTAHGQKWLKTLKGQMEKFQRDHGPHQKELFEALDRTPPERRQQGQLLDTSGAPYSADIIQKMLKDALKEMMEQPL